MSPGVDVQGWVMDPRDWSFEYWFVEAKKAQASGYFAVNIDSPFSHQMTKGNYDIIVLHYASIKCISAALVSLFLDKEVYFFVPNTKFDWRSESKLKEALKKTLFNMAGGLLVTGPRQREYTENYLRKENVSKISVIGNPTRDLSGERGENIIEYKKAFFSKDGGIRLLYVGRLSEEKSLETLLYSLGEVNKEGYLAHLTVVGSGPQLESLKRLSETLSINVEFAGFVQQDGLKPYFMQSDIFVLPSASEPWGLVVNEAMEFCLPLILSSHVGCSPVLLKEGVNGFQFPAGDHKRLANCIIRIASNSHLAEEMGLESKRLVQEHSIDQWCDCVIDAFN